MVSLSRRQVLIAGVALPFIPAVSLAASERLILSGRVVDRHGRALKGAAIAAGDSSNVTDADGRFMVVTSTRAYRGVTCDGQPVEGFATNRRREADGTWRATVSLTR